MTGDHIVIMKDGFILGGTPQEVFNRPANLFVAGILKMNFFDAPIRVDMSSM